MSRDVQVRQLGERRTRRRHERISTKVTAVVALAASGALIASIFLETVSV